MFFIFFGLHQNIIFSSALKTNYYVFFWCFFFTCSFKILALCLYILIGTDVQIVSSIRHAEQISTLFQIL